MTKSIFRRGRVRARTLPALMLAMSLAACGGSGGSAPVVTPNPPVTISGTPAATAQLGHAYTFTPATTDPSGAALSFTVTNPPSWAMFSKSTGQLSGTASPAGTYANITITVTDGATQASLGPFSIQVTAAGSAPPTISGSPATAAVVGQPYSFKPTTTDPSGGPLSFSIVGKPAWASFDATTGQLSGTPTAAGSFPGITISVSDGANSAALNPFTVTVSQAVAGGSLCQGLVTGRQLVSYTPIPKPAKGVPITDPDFGTTITRITDVQADWGGTYAVPSYPTVAAWNIDESYLLLYVSGSSQGNFALLNGRNYAFIKWLPALGNAADIEQWDWDASDPDLIWFINGAALIRYHVSTGASDTVHTFSSAADWGDDPIYFSWNGQLFGLREPATHTILSYNLATGESAHLSTTQESPEACPSGTCLFWNSTAAGQGVLLNPTTMTAIRNITLNTMEHGDLGEDAAGNDVWGAVQYDDGPAGTSGALMVEWLKTGVVKTIFGESAGDPYPPTGTLVSAKALKAPGWFAVAPTGNTALAPTYQDQEIMLANVDTGQTCRVAHHRTTGQNGSIGYFAQPNITFSPSGTRIAFPSDWNAGGGSGTTVDTYIVNLPGYKP